MVLGDLLVLEDLLILDQADILLAAIKILAAIFCGGVIGIERGRSNQAAGMRTYMLVCLGSAVVMMTGQFLHEEYGSGDPARMGAQVISGIGFLGAGSIIISGKTRIRGLTTAAGLWVSACIGLSIGIGYLEVGVLATAAVAMIMTIMKRVEDFFGAQVCIYLEASLTNGVEDISQAIKESGLVITNIRMNEVRKRTHKLIVQIKNGNRYNQEELLCILKNIDGVKYVEYVAW